LVQCLFYWTSAKNVFNFDQIHYTSLTPEKVLNSVICSSLFCIILCISYKLSKMVWLFIVHLVYYVIVIQNTFSAVDLCMSALGEMVTKGLSSQQAAVEDIGDGSVNHIYIPDYTVEAATDLIVVRVSIEQYAGALHAASLDRHLRAVDSRGEGHNYAGGHESDVSGTAGEFPTSSDAPSPMVEGVVHDQPFDSGEMSDEAVRGRNLVLHENKACDV